MKKKNEKDILSSSLAWTKLVDDCINKLQISLIENESVSEKYLQMVSAIFLPKHYYEVVEERSIDTSCGYPVCSKKIKDEKKYFVYDEKNKEYLNPNETMIEHFCSIECYRKSFEFVKTIDLSYPYSRKCHELVKKIFPNVKIEKILGMDNVKDDSSLKFKVKEREVKPIDFEKDFKIETEMKKLQIEDKEEIQEDDLTEEEVEEPYEEDEDVISEFKLSKYQRIWSQLSFWTNSDVRNFFKEGKLPDQHEHSFQFFNESAVKRLEVILENLDKGASFVSQRFKISNIQAHMKRIQEVTNAFSLESQMLSLESGDWIIILLVLLKCLSKTDKSLESEIKKTITKESLENLKINQEQFFLFEDVLTSE